MDQCCATCEQNCAKLSKLCVQNCCVIYEKIEQTAVFYWNDCPIYPKNEQWKEYKYYILSIAHFSDILGNRSNKKQRFVRFLPVLFSPFVANFDQFCTYFVSFCTKPLHNSFVRVG